GQDIQPFCNKPDEIKCMISENTQGLCMLYKHGVEIKPEFQYVDNSFNVPANERKYYGGWVNFDYCPVFSVSYHSLNKFY
ncbi:unnamed protein product, partial [Schistosoma spindalis]